MAFRWYLYDNSWMHTNHIINHSESAKHIWQKKPNMFDTFIFILFSAALNGRYDLQLQFECLFIIFHSSNMELWYILCFDTQSTQLQCHLSCHPIRLAQPQIISNIWLTPDLKDMIWSKYHSLLTYFMHKFIRQKYTLKYCRSMLNFKIYQSMYPHYDVTDNIYRGHCNAVFSI